MSSQKLYRLQNCEGFYLSFLDIDQKPHAWSASAGKTEGLTDQPQAVFMEDRESQAPVTAVLGPFLGMADQVNSKPLPVPLPLHNIVRKHNLLVERFSAGRDSNQSQRLQ